MCQLEDSDTNTRRSAINALGKQTALSDVNCVLQGIVFVLSKDTSNINPTFISMLLMQKNLCDSFPNFDVENLRSLYKLLVRQSFSVQLSCYRQDEAFYINMPDQQTRISLEREYVSGRVSGRGCGFGNATYPIIR